MDLPQANILDDCEPYKNRTEFADFVYIDAGNSNCRNYLDHVMYPGPCWTNWENAMFILDNNITSEKKWITEEHFIAVFKASERIKKETIIKVYNEMENAFQNPLDRDASIKGRHLFKEVRNAMQGSWLTQRFYTYKCNNSPCSEDSIGQIDSYELLGDQLGTCKWNCKTEKLNNKTMYLLGLYTLNNEHLLVAKMIKLTYTIPKISMHGIIVDSILIKGPNKSLKKLKESSPLSYCGDMLYTIKNEHKEKIQAPNFKPITMKTVKPRPSVFLKQRDEELFSLYKPSSFGNWLSFSRFLYERRWTIISEEPLKPNEIFDKKQERLNLTIC